MGAQLQTIAYKTPPKGFKKLHRLIAFRCTQMLAPPCAFGTTGTNLTVFVAPCNEIEKYFYTGAHLQYMV